MELCKGEEQGKHWHSKNKQTKKQPLNLDLYPRVGQWRSILAGAEIFEIFECLKMQKK